MNNIRLLNRSVRILEFFKTKSGKNIEYGTPHFAALTVDSVKLEEKELSVFYRMMVNQDLTNYSGTLHGGAIATLLDVCTTMAIAAMDANTRVTVSVNMGMNFMAPAPMGEEIIIEAVSRRVGKSMAFSDCYFRSAQANKLLCSGQHVKALLDTRFPIEFDPSEII